MTTIDIDAPNEWRLQTPGHAGWEQTARPDDPAKYFIVSADTHAQEPTDLWSTRVAEQYVARLPRTETDETGQRWSYVEGYRPQRLGGFGQPEGEDALRFGSGKTAAERLADHDRDGIDVEIMFPNRGLLMFASTDPAFQMAQATVYNDWAAETFADTGGRILPMAAVPTADVPAAIAEVERTAQLGFKGLTFPCKPFWGEHGPDKPNYNHRRYAEFWDCVASVDLPVTFHVSTGRDPRASSGPGGAVINYVAHSMIPTIEPFALMCGSGILDRHPGIRFGTVEAGIGWIAWAMNAMDEAYRKHHMWVRPELSKLPSEFFRSNGFSTFQEDGPGLLLARELGYIDNVLWANDYPHQEGTWPHSAEAIERTMGRLTHEERAKVLGLNAARIFNIDVPARRQPVPASTA